MAKANEEIGVLVQIAFIGAPSAFHFCDGSTVYAGLRIRGTSAKLLT
jgi:hypothetical protein